MDAQETLRLARQAVAEAHALTPEQVYGLVKMRDRIYRALPNQKIRHMGTRTREHYEALSTARKLLGRAILARLDTTGGRIVAGPVTIADTDDGYFWVHDPDRFDTPARERDSRRRLERLAARGA